MSQLHQTYELFLLATPDRVWRAIVDGAQSSQYFFGTAFSSSLEKGDPFRYAFADGTVAADGVVTEARPGERLETTWAVHYDPSCAGETSRVVWSLEARGAALTKLTLTHDCEAAPNTARNVGKDGWSYVLSGLKSLVETGHALPSPQPS